MKIGEFINGYKVIGVDGKNFSTKGGGLSMWTFVVKGGVEYFMKEFLSPTYPVAGSPGSAKTKGEKMAKCVEFEKHHVELKERIGKNVSAGGNLVITLDFFRYGSKYYKTTEKVDNSSIDIVAISKLPIEKRFLILKTISHSLSILHNLNIVHGDLKPNNILIKKSDKNIYTTKLIDFDNSYLSGFPPNARDEIVGDPLYYSPELENYILRRGTVNGSQLTIKSDIFALGLIFCQYLTGVFPLGIPLGKYASNIVNNGGNLRIDNKSHFFAAELEDLVNSMLFKNPIDRPAIGHVFTTLKHIASMAKGVNHDAEDETGTIPYTASSPVSKKVLVKNITKVGRLQISMGYKSGKK